MINSTVGGRAAVISVTPCQTVFLIYMQMCASGYIEMKLNFVSEVYTGFIVSSNIKICVSVHVFDRCLD